MAFWLIVPSLLAIAVVTAYPVIATFVYSFQHRVSTDPHTGWVGLANFDRLIHDPTFWHALWFTVAYAVVSVALQFVVGLAFALLGHRNFRGRGIVRGALLFPWAMPTVITAKVWQFMYNEQYGLFNRLFDLVGLPHHIVWLGSANTAITALLGLSTWKVNSFFALVLLAALAAIPRDVYEASSLDGASAWQQFRYVTLPYLRPAITVVLILRTVEALQAFDIIVGLSNGGPGNATQNLPLYIYNTSFLGLDFGYGSALAVAMFVVIFVIVIIYLRLFNRSDDLG